MNNLNALRRSIAGVSSFSVWTTVGFQDLSSEGYRDALGEAGVFMDPAARRALKGILVSTSLKRTELDLVLPTVRELGFVRGAPVDEICAKAVWFGLEVCPAEAAPALRLQYRDQPDGERLMMPVQTWRDGKRRKDIFYLSNSSYGRGLTAAVEPSKHFWHGFNRAIFVQPR